MKAIIRISFVWLLVFAFQSWPLAAQAQSTNKTAKAATEKKDAQAKKPSPGPFHGNLAALDSSAKTITVGKRTFQITSETKINKLGKPATLDAGIVGEEVSGYVKPADDGKWIATTVNFGPKAQKKASEKKAPEKKS